MARRSKSKFLYRCSFPTCDNQMGTDVNLGDYPECHGAHNKIMDFYEAESLEVPEHIKSSNQKPISYFSDDRKVNGGNWIG